MNNYDRLAELLKNTKEDAPISCKFFREFLDNHFYHLVKDVNFNRKLLWIILAAIIAAAIAGKLF